MAGSRKDMLYTADNGDQYAVNIDESNGEAAGFDDISLLTDLVFTNGYPRMPKGMTMRYANVRGDDGSTRKIWVGKPSSVSPAGIFAGVIRSILLPVFFSIGGVSEAIAFTIISVVGESNLRKALSFDSGLNDGDST